MRSALPALLGTHDFRAFQAAGGSAKTTVREITAANLVRQGDELVLTLSGRDASGARRDLVFRRRYRDCLPAGPELPQQWAGQKILHLLAERTLIVEPQARVQLQREIRRVAAEHNVFVPY